MSEPILVVNRLGMTFPGRRGLGAWVRRVPAPPVRAVDGISFDLRPGEVLALVGESGSGKTTTGNLLMGLLTPSAGSVLLEGRHVAGLSRSDLAAARRQIQMIFQDPYESLNPRQRVSDIVAEPLRVHRVTSTPAEERDRVRSALVQAGLDPPDAYADRLPFELSGGQRQRVAIATALVLDPRVLVADEPVSMLDVSIRAEILNLIRRLATDRQIAVLMITHDLATVIAYADRVAVMYLGRIVEIGPTRQVVADPKHPYTRALLSVLPVPDPDARRRPLILVGETPDPARIPSGCRFHPRCPVAIERCRSVDPVLVPVGAAHEAACILVGDQPLVAPEAPEAPEELEASEAD